MYVEEVLMTERQKWSVHTWHHAMHACPDLPGCPSSFDINKGQVLEWHSGLSQALHSNRPFIMLVEPCLHLGLKGGGAGSVQGQKPRILQSWQREMT